MARRIIHFAFPLVLRATFISRRWLHLPLRLPSSKQEQTLLLGGLIFSIFMVPILVLCIWFIFASPDQEVIAIPMNCVKLGQTYLSRIYFQSSDSLFTVKKAGPTMKCRAATCCTACWDLPSTEPQRGSRLIWGRSTNYFGERDLQL